MLVPFISDTMSSHGDLNGHEAGYASRASAAAAGAEIDPNPAPIELLNFEADLIASMSPIRLATARAGDESKPKARSNDDAMEDNDAYFDDEMMASKMPANSVPAAASAAVANTSNDVSPVATSPAFAAAASADGSSWKDDYSTGGKDEDDFAQSNAPPHEQEAFGIEAHVSKKQVPPQVAASSHVAAAKEPSSSPPFVSDGTNEDQESNLDTGATKPGAVSVGAGAAALSQMEQDIIAKQMSGGSSRLLQMEQDVVAKQEANRGSPAVLPGAVAVGGSPLSQLEQDVLAKQQASERSGELTPGVVAVGGSQLSQMERDVAAKQRAGSAMSSSPGAIAVGGAQLSQMEQDVAAKEGVNQLSLGDDRRTMTVGGSQLSQMEQDVVSKQRASQSSFDVAPGAVAVGGSQLSQMEQDVISKQRASQRSFDVAPGAVAVGGSQLSQMEGDVAAKQRGDSFAVGGPQLSQMEQDVAAKSNSAGGSTLSQLEQDVTAKRQASQPGAMANERAQLSQLEEDVAAKHGGLANAAVLAPGALLVTAATGPGASSELNTMEDVVNQKNQFGSMGTGQSELTSLEDALFNKAQVDNGREASGVLSEVADKSGFGEGSFPEAPKALEPEQAPKGNDQMGSGVAAGVAPDVEYGVDEPNYEGLAVATPVRDEEEDAHIQPAIEYDPDAKQPLSTYRRRRFRLYAFLAFFALVAAAVGAVIGVVVKDNSKSESSSTSYRETLGIKERIQRLVGIEELDDPESPYAKALEWITHDDPFEVVPDSPNFIQRYICVYFYFATTIEGPWRSCNPPGEGDPDFCAFSKLANVDPPAYREFSWTRWLTGRHECAWAGLACDDALQIRAVEISTYRMFLCSNCCVDVSHSALFVTGGQEMSGTFPAGLKHMPFLQSVALIANSLKGPLPPDLMEMKYLVNLELHFNEFTGPIPEEWWNAQNLGRLNLIQNLLTGTISSKIANMQDLGALYLDGNRLKGTIPKEIGKLSTLRFMRLGNNELDGSIPEEMGGMASIESLRLQSNKLSGDLPDMFQNMTSLNDFRVQDNVDLGGPLPDSFFQMSLLRRMDFRGCQFSGPLTPRPEWTKFSRLLELLLTGNPFSGPFPEEIKSLRRLRTIQVAGTDLTGNFPQEICDMLGNNVDVVSGLEANCREDVPNGPELNCTCCGTCCDTNGENCLVQ